MEIALVLSEHKWGKSPVVRIVILKKAGFFQTTNSLCEFVISCIGNV
ncbi:MAG: hypothetical protein V1839_00585 [archaeon]